MSCSSSNNSSSRQVRTVGSRGNVEVRHSRRNSWLLNQLRRKKLTPVFQVCGREVLRTGREVLVLHRMAATKR